jgi:hypothetical protein
LEQTWKGVRKFVASSSRTTLHISELEHHFVWLTL